MTKRFLFPWLTDLFTYYFSLFVALSIWRMGFVDGNTYATAAIQFTPFFCMSLLVLVMLDLYDLRTVRQFPMLVQNLMVSSIVNWGIGITYFYLMATLLTYTPKTDLLLTILLSSAFILAFRRVWLKLCDYHIAEQRVVLLGDPQHVNALRHDLVRLSPDTGFTPVPWRWPGVDLVVADGHWVDNHWDEAKEVFMAAARHKVPIISFENFYESILGKVSPEYASNPSWALEFVFSESNSLYKKVKRLMDFVMSLALLLALSPVIAAVCVLIFLLDGRPVFYTQKRIGYLCREFSIWKFRTMERAAEKDGPFASAKSSRSQITALGYWLRRFRLDELPQLWNVLRGEMSMVGPRPEWAEEVNVLAMVIPNYHLRHLTSPGITGWAQVYFKATNNHIDSMEKLHYDLFYLKYFSLSLDFSILLKTVKRMFVHDSGIAAGPTIAPPAMRPKRDWVRDFKPVVGVPVPMSAPDKVGGLRMDQPVTS